MNHYTTVNANLNSLDYRLTRRAEGTNHVDQDWRMQALERAADLFQAGYWSESREQAEAARDYAEWMTASRAMNGGRG